ncbi:MAG: class I SAM-dependent RNA methyltransferase [Planctomycetaceae bacterium]
MPSNSLDLMATTAFGLEAVVARELKQLGYPDQQVSDGRIVFAGTQLAVCRANLWLRSAERVLIRIAEFEARDFGELFDKTHAIPWAEWLPETAEFPVAGKSSRSQLHSVPHCQSIVKKAIVERLKDTYHRSQFEETGPVFRLEVALVKDRVTLSLDTSGQGLHKRGYRSSGGVAPLKESLAAALIQLSHWNRDRTLVDPFCGTGTLPIEAAMIGRNLAPGIQRQFDSEDWPWISAQSWQEARTEARDVARDNLGAPIIGMDCDARVLNSSRAHARAAGVDADIHFQQSDIKQFNSSRQYGCVITNPPYGERLGDRQTAGTLYREMSDRFRSLDTWSMYILTSHPRFEHCYGRPADRRRKLYNGRIECCYYQYRGPRPPRPTAATLDSRTDIPSPSPPA